MRTYFGGIRYIGGEPHGFCWIDVQGDGGAYAPDVTVETLKQALDKKLSDYSTPEKQVHLRAHALSELYLLVHGGFNAYAYNSPSGPLSLETIAQRGAAFYASHTQRQVFKRVWFFNSLDSADDINQLFGYAPGYGRVRRSKRLRRARGYRCHGSDAGVLSRGSLRPDREGVRHDLQAPKLSP